MLPPLYLLWLLWPNCPLVPPRCRTIVPINPKPGTYWLRKQASLDPMREPVREPLHIRHFPRHYGSSFAAVALLEARHRANIGVDMAAEGQDHTVLVAIHGGSPQTAASMDEARGRANVVIYYDEPAFEGKQDVAAPFERPLPSVTPKSRQRVHATAPKLILKPRTNFKQYRKPRGLTSAARRRQHNRCSNRRRNK